MSQAADSGGRDFEGDEFANNLFSDLAPLLTLFGEQVTKQFLSMSMGWADNVLLAMGPLGILTIAVSAIRVGGVRQLKALVGRARESRSTAEQELLSSTSEDVCELWNGKDIVRTIGSPAGMKNLIVTKQEDGRTGIHCFDKVNDDLSDAAPNLALNVKNATAPTRELWLWAALGIVLQLTAMAIPGLATYYWKWGKGDSPVASYGYPCFLVGTSLVVAGAIACGHVIEGITEEHDFMPWPNSGKRFVVRQVVRLQRSCTVGDQHFPPVAIYNSPGNQVLRISRLTSQSYSSLAATATAMTVVGFIVQFIGPRALHWSATIGQLRVTLLMTGVRAYVRRGLATSPNRHTLLEGHETASLTLLLLQDNAGEEPAGCTPHILHLWEIPTLCDYDYRQYTHRLRIPDERGFVLGHLFPEEDFTMPLGLGGFLPPKRTDGQWNTAGRLSVPEAVGLYDTVQAWMPQTSRTTEVAEMLAKAVERLADIFAHSGDIKWAGDVNPFLAPYRWGLPAMEQMYSRNRRLTVTQFILFHRPSTDAYPARPGEWVLCRRGKLHGVLALWLCTLRRRDGAIRWASSSRLVDRHDYRHHLGEHEFSLRVVARGDQQDPRLDGWLGQKVYRSRKATGIGISHRGTIDVDSNIAPRGYRPWPIFGAFLSTSALPRQSEHRTDDLYVDMYRGLELALQCAQEILSLFILQVASRVDSLGHKVTPNQQAGMALDGPQENAPSGARQLFQDLGGAVVDTGLARNITEAYALIIPAFHHYGLLPEVPE